MKSFPTILAVCLMTITSTISFGKNINSESSNLPQQTAHFSIDDVFEPLQDITVNKDNYNSVFDNEFFAFLKELHDRYGICVTCNLFYRTHSEFTLAQVTDRFKDEFIRNSSWLKFSWHGRNGFERYTNEELNTQANESYTAVNDEICRFAGRESLSTFIRPSFFSGNKELWKMLSESKYGLDGIYGSDDGREADAGLSEVERATLAADYRYTDPETDIKYVKSLVRFDGKAPQQGTEIVKNVFERKDKIEMYGIFMHQQSVTPYDANACDACIEAIKFLRGKNIAFTFPEK